MPITPEFHYQIREVDPDDMAALFVVHAAITPTGAGLLLEWTQELEERLESGGRAWVIARGRRAAGYATIDPLPGLPGVYDLAGGIVPARRRQGLGGRLLRHVQTMAAETGARQLSGRVQRLEDETATFMLHHGFFVEHEECLLELADLSDLPPTPVDPPGEQVTYSQGRAVSEFCRVYDTAFAGKAWSQPYTEIEVAAMLAQPEDLLFTIRDGEPIGVVWHEVLPDGRGRVEPLGIAPEFQGRGYGRRLLLAALHELRRRRARVVEIGTWRDNAAALGLYGSLGFVEVDNWFYLAYDVAGGLKSE